MTPSERQTQNRLTAFAKRDELDEILKIRSPKWFWRRRPAYVSVEEWPDLLHRLSLPEQGEPARNVVHEAKDAENHSLEAKGDAIRIVTNVGTITVFYD